MSGTEAPSSDVHHVAVKFATFWVKNPAMWFRQAEAMFLRAHISAQLTMHDHIIEKLPKDVITSIQHVIENITPSTADPYDRVKTHLVRDITPTKWRRMDTLLDHPNLGDRRPSAIMYAMLTELPPGEEPGLLFQALFLRRLPSEIKCPLCATDFDSPRMMAEYADRLWDGRVHQLTFTAGVHAVPVPCPPSQS